MINKIFFFNKEKDDDEKTIICPNCNKVIYKNELCSCQKNKEKW